MRSIRVTLYKIPFLTLFAVSLVLTALLITLLLLAIPIIIIILTISALTTYTITIIKSIVNLFKHSKPIT